MEQKKVVKKADNWVDEKVELTAFVTVEQLEIRMDEYMVV